MLRFVYSISIFRKPCYDRGRLIETATEQKNFTIKKHSKLHKKLENKFWVTLKNLSSHFPFWQSVSIRLLKFSIYHWIKINFFIYVQIRLGTKLITVNVFFFNHTFLDSIYMWDASLLTTTRVLVCVLIYTWP